MAEWKADRTADRLVAHLACSKADYSAVWTVALKVDHLADWMVR